jgi:predicted ATP-dependent endonuclease of OLD family
VEPRITKETISAGRNQGQKAVVDELKLRIRDDRHWLSLPFDEHSSGFRWFFSFLAAFSKYEHTDEPLVILLDEPALGLHAKAQADFLRYIEERLAPRCQVVYTTHSPFMVEPGKLERVRLLEDKTDDESREPEGVTISADVTSTDQDTLFPLQGALGYDLVQHLFIGPHNLVVEGTSDYTYLTVISDYLGSLEEDRVTLDDRWSVVPVGGASQVPSFVALLGSHLDVTVLVDAQKKGHQRLAYMADQGILQENRILTIGGVLDRSAADIEDLFAKEDYLDLYNRAFRKEVTTGDLQGDDPIVRRLARFEGEDRFDHGVPADELLRHRDEILPDLIEDTLDRFEALFEEINRTLQE